MIKINYGTNNRFNDDDGDKYYCKSFTSAKRKLKEVIKMWNERGEKDNEKEILKEYDIWVFNKKTMWNNGIAQIEIGDLYISIEEINLI